MSKHAGNRTARDAKRRRARHERRASQRWRQLHVIIPSSRGGILVGRFAERCPQGDRHKIAPGLNRWPTCVRCGADGAILYDKVA